MKEDQKNSFSLNQKVKVSFDHHWAKGQIGIISNVPEQVKALNSGWENDYSRKVKTRNGEKLFYWIRFDSPQLDADGDGLYREAEIEKRFLELIT